ncbi:hypothetical protein GSY71_06390 [Pusillimonas sp. TS35]|nr:hypothetical protein [Pusillimonas sp. TS35]
MKHTYDNILLNLPVDQTLRQFLMNQGLPLPVDLDWNDEAATSTRLVEAVQQWADVGKRDALIAELHRVAGLSDEAGRRAILEVSAFEADVLMPMLRVQQSDLQRAFWLHVHHPHLFDQACDSLFFERYAHKAQQHDLGICVEPDVTGKALDLFCGAMCEFYQRSHGNGEHGVPYVLRRASQNILLTLHLKDLPMLRLEFEGMELHRRLGSPDFVLALEYCPRTGVVRSLVAGGAKYHQALLEAFAQHILHAASVDAQRLRPPSLDLSSLKLGVQVPQAIEDGFVQLQVKSLALLSPQGDLRLQATAQGASKYQCVTDLLGENFPQENPLDQGWTITAAQINLYYPPPPNLTRRKVISIEVTSKGRLNLHKYDEALQAQLEGYLVDIGILVAGQTLVAQEAPPDMDDVFDPPLVEA